MSSSSTSDEEIPVLPTDVQIEIMKRLPVKSLLRFTQVSKQWKSIIKSPRFISDYNKRIQHLNHVYVYDCEDNHVHIFDDDNRFLHRITAPMAAEYQKLRFMGYSQGLFAFRCHKYESFKVFAVVIWNPSIRKSVYIPVSENGDKQFGTFGFTVCNATDPTIFKIPRTHGCVDPVHVDIFTLSTGDWRTFSIDPPRKSLGLQRVWEVIDRFIYWHAVEGNHYTILSFDIISQQFTELCLPPSLTSRESGFGLGLSQHKESLVVLQWDVSKQEDSVWMMEPGGVENSFRKLYTIRAPPYALQFSDVIGFRENGQPIIGMMLSENGWETTGPMYRIGTRMKNRRSAPLMNLFSLNTKLTFIFYEPDLERFNDIQISGYGSRAGSYMETLLLLDH